MYNPVLAPFAGHRPVYVKNGILFKNQRRLIGGGNTLIPNKFGDIEPILFRPILQPQHSPGANSRANAASNAGRPDNILTPLRVPSYINAHFTIGGAVATRDALAAVRCDSESRFEALDQTQIRCQRASEPAPDTIAHQRIESRTDYAGKHGTYQESVACFYAFGADTQQRVTSGKEGVQHGTCIDYGIYQNCMNHPAFYFPGF